MIALDPQTEQQLENIAQQTQQSVQKLIQSLIADYQQKQDSKPPNKETIAAIEAVERGEVETTSLEELRKLAKI